LAQLHNKARPKFSGSRVLQQIAGFHIGISDILIIQEPFAIECQGICVINQPSITDTLSLYQLDQIQVKPSQFSKILCTHSFGTNQTKYRSLQ
jgi:hypothetical protein